MVGSGASEVIAVAVVLALGALTRSVFGFGDAAVAMPLLALLGVRIGVAVPLVGLVGFVVAASAVVDGWKEVDHGALKRLSVATIVGVPFGVLLVTRASEPLVVRSLGGLLLVYAAHALIRPSERRVRGGGWAYVFGFAAGSLGSAYNFNGVPVAVYGTLRRWPAERFRSTLQGHFVISSVLVVAGHALGGLWTEEVFGLLAVSLPGIVVAVPLGRALNRRLPADRFARSVYVVIAVLGLVLLW